MLSAQLGKAAHQEAAAEARSNLAIGSQEQGEVQPRLKCSTHCPVLTYSARNCRFGVKPEVPVKRVELCPQFRAHELGLLISQGESMRVSRGYRRAVLSCAGALRFKQLLGVHACLSTLCFDLSLRFCGCRSCLAEKLTGLCMLLLFDCQLLLCVVKLATHLVQSDLHKSNGFGGRSCRGLTLSCHHCQLIGSLLRTLRT